MKQSGGIIVAPGDIAFALPSDQNVKLQEYTFLLLLLSLPEVINYYSLILLV